MSYFKFSSSCIHTETYDLIKSVSSTGVSTDVYNVVLSETFEGPLDSINSTLREGKIAMIEKHFQGLNLVGLRLLDAPMSDIVRVFKDLDSVLPIISLNTDLMPTAETIVTDESIFSTRTNMTNAVASRIDEKRDYHLIVRTYEKYCCKVLKLMECHKAQHKGISAHVSIYLCNSLETFVDAFKVAICEGVQSMSNRVASAQDPEFSCDQLNLEELEALLQMPCSNYSHEQTLRRVLLRMLQSIIYLRTNVITAIVDMAVNLFPNEHLLTKSNNCSTLSGFDTVASSQVNIEHYNINVLATL